MTANGKMEVCYNAQTAVDAKNKPVAEFEVTNEGNDKNRIAPMGERAKTVLGTDKLTAAADTGYDNARDILESMAGGIEPHAAGTDFDVRVPTEEPGPAAIVSQKDGRRVYTTGRNIVLCPTGKTLYPFFTRNPQSKGCFTTVRPAGNAAANALKRSGGGGIKRL
jgi:hypothetical protein